MKKYIIILVILLCLLIFLAFPILGNSSVTFGLENTLPRQVPDGVESTDSDSENSFYFQGSYLTNPFFKLPWGNVSFSGYINLFWKGYINSAEIEELSFTIIPILANFQYGKVGIGLKFLPDLQFPQFVMMQEFYIDNFTIKSYLSLQTALSQEELVINPDFGSLDSEYKNLFNFRINVNYLIPENLKLKKFIDNFGINLGVSYSNVPQQWYEEGEQVVDISTGYLAWFYPWNFDISLSCNLTKYNKIYFGAKTNYGNNSFGVPQMTWTTGVEFGLI